MRTKLPFRNELRTATCRSFAPNNVNPSDAVTYIVLGIDVPKPTGTAYLSILEPPRVVGNVIV